VTGYFAVFVYLVTIVAFAVVSLAAASLLRPTRGYLSKYENYECGAQPIGEAWVQFPVGFYLVALVFLVADAGVVFLFPWALALAGLGVQALVAMFAFLGVLGLGWAYAYREGIFEWK
jgi:NADH-quinone oxidoreductase subunit A